MLFKKCTCKKENIAKNFWSMNVREKIKKVISIQTAHIINAWRNRFLKANRVTLKNQNAKEDDEEENKVTSR